MSAVSTLSLSVPTHGKGFYEITERLEDALARSRLHNGVLTVFCRHTSASLLITENADPTARADLQAYLERIVPENADYAHDLEGPDDAASHIKCALTHTSETIPFANGRLCLGTWQGVFVWEHRRAPHTREITLSFCGE